MDVSVTGVAPNAYQICFAALGFAKALKAATADGWDASKDLPDVLKAALTALVPSVNAFPDAMAECKADLQGVVKAAVLAAMDAYELAK